MNDDRKSFLLDSISIDSRGNPGIGNDGDIIDEEQEDSLPTWPDKKKAEEMLAAARASLEKSGGDNNE
jgi:hypothetical protein